MTPEPLKLSLRRFRVPSVHYSIGIDPGLSGSIVVVSGSKPSAPSQIVAYYDLNDARLASTGIPLRGTYLSPVDIVAFLSPWVPRVFNIVLEDVSVQTGTEGRVSMFKFGWVKGLLTGLVVGMSPDVTIHYLKPAVWKLNMGLGTNKRDSMRLACEKFPQHTHLFKYVKYADRAEAALLALCGLRLI